MERSGIVYYVWKSCILTQVKKSYVCPIFLPFWSQNRSTFHITYYIGILPKFFASIRFFYLVYMIFKYSKRFRFAPSFNNVTLQFAHFFSFSYWDNGDPQERVLKWSGLISTWYIWTHALEIVDYQEVKPNIQIIFK